MKLLPLALILSPILISNGCVGAQSSEVTSPVLTLRGLTANNNLVVYFIGAEVTANLMRDELIMIDLSEVVRLREELEDGFRYIPNIKYLAAGDSFAKIWLKISLDLVVVNEAELEVQVITRKFAISGVPSELGRKGGELDAIGAGSLILIRRRSI